MILSLSLSLCLSLLLLPCLTLSLADDDDDDEHYAPDNGPTGSYSLAHGARAKKPYLTNIPYQSLIELYLPVYQPAPSFE